MVPIFIQFSYGQISIENALHSFIDIKQNLHFAGLGKEGVLETISHFDFKCLIVKSLAETKSHKSSWIQERYCNLMYDIGWSRKCLVNKFIKET